LFLLLDFVKKKKKINIDLAMVASQWVNKRKEKKRILNINLAVRTSQWLKEAVYNTYIVVSPD